MNNVPPVFEKKEINYSGYIYNYMPVDMPVYTAEVTHRDPVSGELLQKALDRTLKRMPYLADIIHHRNHRWRMM